MVEITNTKLKINTASTVEASKALSTSGTLIDYTKKDDGKILILLDNSAGETTCTILKGNALQGAKDLSFKVAGSSVSGLVVESGLFVNAQGENKGKLVIKGAAQVKAQVIELP